MNKTRFLLLFLFALAITSFGLAGTSLAVTLRSHVEVGHPTVKLSDVFDGLPADIDCDIARAPDPGKSIVYDVNVLKHLAQKYKLDWQPESSGDHTTVVTVASRITGDDIRPYIVQKIEDLNVAGDIDVLFDGRGLDLAVPPDQSTNLMLNNFTYDAINKRFHAELLANSFAGPIDLPLAGRIVIRRSIPVLAHHLEAGTVIGTADIEWLSVPEDRAAGAIANADQLTGHEVQRDIEAGQPIHEHDVIPPRLVMRGTLVTMKIETPFMTVTAQGRALQDGKRGDVVRVTNTQSNRVIEGVVEDTGVVCVPMAEKVALAAPAGKQD